ncbi:MAG: hypothetical protein FJZ01_09150 [Candidatus Sericytochromatia bacterium]|nr:hypothetical protein [Candidatus Tanganyikabacteria bacterium]
MTQHPDPRRPGRGGKRPGAGRKPLSEGDRRQELRLYLAAADLADLDRWQALGFASRADAAAMAIRLALAIADLGIVTTPAGAETVARSPAGWLRRWAMQQDRR